MASPSPTQWYLQLELATGTYLLVKAQLFAQLSAAGTRSGNQRGRARSAHAPYGRKEPSGCACAVGRSGASAFAARKSTRDAGGMVPRCQVSVGTPRGCVCLFLFPPQTRCCSARRAVQPPDCAVTVTAAQTPPLRAWLRPPQGKFRLLRFMNSWPPRCRCRRRLISEVTFDLSPSLRLFVLMKTGFQFKKKYT